MNLNDLKVMMLANQYLIEKADKKSVVRDMCGLQAQFLVNAYHALSIRCKEKLSADEWGTGLAKTWTIIRGTVHVICQEDLGIFLPDLSQEDINTYRIDRYITAERKNYFADLIVKLIDSGVYEREALKEKCFEAGMTQVESECVFNPWGGVLREMAERGKICYKVQEKKAFCLCPNFKAVDDYTSRLEIARRYFTNYGPATLKDASYFMGVPQKQVKEWLDKLPYCTIEVENKTYYYIPNQKNYKHDIPRCIFLAGFDPLMLGYYKNESLFLPSEYLRGIFNLAGIVMPAILYNGRVIGKWKKSKNKLLLTPFEHISSDTRKDITDAAEQQWGNTIQPVFMDK